ncbi:hypothetical protein DFH11DRAFT_1558535 [Phellopilus nigrolimitatus]|nr:hypothetical protein DFH11DRAFT_1558535 [Phellopilus nigrolimitatus]
MQLTLKHFILKGEVFSLYRFAIRAKETVRWIREEIERNRHVQDVVHLKKVLPMR